MEFEFREHGSLQAVKLLLDRYEGEAVHCDGLAVRDSKGELPLHHAASTRYWDTPAINNRETVQLLFQCPPSWGANRKQLHLACGNDRDFSLEVIRVLLDLDLLSVLEKTENGKPPLKSLFETQHSLETRRYLRDRQDEALQFLCDDVLDPVPAEVFVEIRGFIMGTLWRPTDKELNDLSFSLCR